MRIFFRLLATIAVLTTLSELFVRAALTLPAQSISDDELGWVYKPYSTVFFTREGRATNKMNSMGFNDDDPDVGGEKFHVLVLGDSVTEALQVPKSENFTSITEVMAPCLDLYNAGRSGLSPVHYPTVFSRVMRPVAPLLTVVVISSEDMFSIRDGNYEIIRDDTNKRIIGLRLNEKPLNKLRVKLDPILSRSALATYLMQRAKALLLNKHIENSTKDKIEVVTPDADEQRIHEILVYLFRDLNSKNPIAILYIPKMEYGANRVATVGKQSVEFEQLIKNAAKLAGVTVSSAEAYMKASYREHGQPGVGFANKNILGGHLNRLGHQATALALLELVANVGLQCPTVINLQKTLTQP